MNYLTFLRERRFAWLVDLTFLSLACAIYVFICCLFLGHESSYFDEGFTSYLARFSPLEIAHYTALDVHPPLYYIALHYWQQLVGIDVFSLRLMSVLWGVVAIIFTFLSVRRLFGRMAALSTLLFVILSPLFIRYSEAMRMYTMALAIISAATYLLVLLHRPDTQHRRTLWVLYAILVSAGMWTNYFTAFIWLAHFIWIGSEALMKRPRAQQQSARRFAKHWSIAIAAAILLYLPWLPRLIVRFTDVQSTGFWIKPLSVDTLVSTITTALVYKNASQTTGWIALLVCVYSALVVYVIVKAYSQALPLQRSHLRLFAICSITPIAGLILLSLPPLQSSYVYRYVIAGVFMTSVVVGIGVSLVTFSSHQVLKKCALYSLSLVILISGVIAVKQAGNRSLDTGVKNMVAQAVWRIHREGTPGSPIVSRSPYTYYTASLYETKDYPVYYTYSRSLNTVGSTHMLYDHPKQRGIMNLNSFTKNHTAIWIIAEDRSSTKHPPAPGWKQAQRFTLYDQSSRNPTVFASEYIKP